MRAVGLVPVLSTQIVGSLLSRGMDIMLPGVEQRLQDRYQLLVQEHTGHAHPVASGPRHLPAAATTKAAAQAAWRFYHNPQVTPTRLAQPLIEAACQAAQD